LIFVIERDCVYCDGGSKYLNMIQVRLSSEGAVGTETK
jgi:hypothetical protein